MQVMLSHTTDVHIHTTDAHIHTIDIQVMYTHNCLIQLSASYLFVQIKHNINIYIFIHIHVSSLCFLVSVSLSLWTFPVIRYKSLMHKQNLFQEIRQNDGMSMRLHIYTIYITHVKNSFP